MAIWSAPARASARQPQPVMEPLRALAAAARVHDRENGHQRPPIDSRTPRPRSRGTPRRNAASRYQRSAKSATFDRTVSIKASEVPSVRRATRSHRTPTMRACRKPWRFIERCGALARRERLQYSTPK